MMRLIKKRIEINKKYCSQYCAFREDFMDYQQCALFGKKLKNKNKYLKLFPVNIRCLDCISLLKNI